MDILIIGGGGREHALAWKIKQSPECGQLYVAPGNAGTARIAENVQIDVKNNDAVVAFAKEKNIGLVVVAPDDYLAQGMVDALSAAGIPAFGPTQSAARLEWSKAFAKEFMTKHGVPTAASKTFSSFSDAASYIKTVSPPVVIKADGLALGKGVVIAGRADVAEDTLRAFMEKGQFGESGKTVVIEEFLKGTEASLHAFSDGKTAKLFPVARDHKRVGDGNTGHNTGGMGTIAPVSVPADFLKQAEERVVMPVINAMAASGTPYKGVLFPGIMGSADDFKVLEYNARFGDPECESYMRILESDLVKIMLACVNGTLAETDVRWSAQSVVSVILASGGYPEHYEKSFPISGIEDAESDPAVVVFHAGVAEKDGQLVTSGGRVLAVSAVGANPEEAKDKAYAAARKIHFQGSQMRTDIGAFWSF
jgi:phosphoribosylamine--glycine ligase